ncbi:MAG: oligoendopeptidase F [Acidobacteria bacterium]|nr:MAG: oligoendopeptidase F [Acidobacteriota bacterium]
MLMKSSIVVCVGFLAIAAALPTSAEDGFEEQALYETREAIPEAYRWNLDDIFPSTPAWDQAALALDERIVTLESFKGTVGQSAEKLADVLDLNSEISRNASDLFVYAAQWQTTDTRDAEANQYRSRANALMARIGQASSFIAPEVAQIQNEQLVEFMASPRLKTYAHVIDNMTRLKAHTRSTEVEEVLAGASLLQGAPVQIYQGMVSADIQWPEIKDSNGETTKVIPALFYSFMGNQDRRIRKDAALALFGTYDQFGHALAGTYSASINKDIWLAQTRGYDSTLDMALTQTNVPRSVVDTLVGAVHDNIDAIHDYVALRKKILELDDFHIYDLYVSMVPAAEKKYTFVEGWDLATRFWNDTMGTEYAAVAQRALDDRWVDVYPNTGKQGGAYSWGTYNSHPYLFLNWGGTLGDVFTLVHEMGHSIHSHLANEAMPFHDADYSLFVAEVASVASESLFFNWLLDQTDDPTQRLALLNLRMNNITGTFLRQIFFHEFEAAAHKAAEAGEPLTKDTLDTLWGDLWMEYYGEAATLDDVYRSGWARIPHFYRTFYVWVYATSFAAGEAIAGRFRSGDESAVEDYLATLKLGGSVYPMEALARAGVDMNDPTVISTVMDTYRGILAEMEKLLAQ